MAAHCSLFLSSTAFPTVRAPYCSADGSGLFVLSLVNGFHDGYAPYCSADGSGLLIPPLVNCFHDGSRAVLLSGWQRIAHTSARQRLPRRFARCIAQRMAAPCLVLHSLTAFPTVRAPYCSADGSRLLTLTLVNGFHDGLRAVLFPGWQRIGHTSARQWLSRRFAHRIAKRMVADCSFFLSTTAFMPVCAPYC